MKKLIILFLFGLSLNSYGQLDIIKRTVTTDSIKARVDSIYMFGPVTMNTELNVRDTAIVDLIKYYAIGNIINLGTSGQIPYMNPAGSDLLYSSNFEWNDTILTIKDNLYNTYIGYRNSLNNTTATKNVSIGYLAANNTTTGIDNVFIGYYADYNNTTSSQNVIIGSNASTGITTKGQNVIIGFGAGAFNTNEHNTFLGYKAGNNSSGSDNIFLGYNAGYNETGSNKLYIENSNSSSPLIYGEFDNDILRFNADTIYNTGYLQSDSGSYEVEIAKYGRIASYDITTADTWLPLKVDTIYENETTSGFMLNYDSSKVIVNFDGIIEIEGQASFLNNSTGSVVASIYFRLLKNGVEQPDFNIAKSRTFAANGADALGQLGNTLSVTKNDSISVQVRVSNINIDLEGVDSGIFDKINTGTINFKELKTKKH